MLHIVSRMRGPEKIKITIGPVTYLCNAFPDQNSFKGVFWSK
jgi:hypothetical protein